ncbi:MAG: hypothetical protein KDA24_24900 [Deltaproteobacteria bacterium]|nr:hypothetical protein [Deltaproteobacteria bacterium]
MLRDTRSFLLLALLGMAVPLTGCPVEGDDDDAVGDDDDAAGLDCGPGQVGGEDAFCILSGTIVENWTIPAGVPYLLRAGVTIGDDTSETVLTIEAGATIFGESATDGLLVIARNSRIEANGTAAAPIVFSSDKEAGSRARGDWGGLIINGNAPINSADPAECDNEDGWAFGEGGTGWYGGCDVDDNSGTLNYVRVEFAGTLVSPDNELNGVAFQGVGAGTTVDYLQVHMNADDGVEFFGGTVSAKHLVLTGIGDDSLDWTDGWQGNAQFVLAQQYDDASDNGIEADNNGDDRLAAPLSAPRLANVTLIGAPSSDASDVGMLLREGTAANLMNVLVTDFNDACLDIDHDETFANVDSGDLTLEYATLDCSTNISPDDEEAAQQSFFDAGTGNVEAAIDLTDWVPTTEIAGGDPSAWDSWFDAATYQGAIGSVDWTADWTTDATN